MLDQKLIPCLWFDKDAENAMKFYIKIFNDAPYNKKKSKIISINRYEKGIETPSGPEMEGKVLTGIFELNGQKFMCLDGGPIFKFNEAISVMIECLDQRELDYFWNQLSSVPESEVCGWLKDKYGLSWQIIPKRMNELLSDKNIDKRHRVLNVMLKMKKIIIADLEKAAVG